MKTPVRAGHDILGAHSTLKPVLLLGTAGESAHSGRLNALALRATLQILDCDEDEEVEFHSPFRTRL